MVTFLREKDGDAPVVLNDEQNDRFFDTMDPLLYYVNDRFKVVEGFALGGASPIDDLKCSLVSRTLWENVQVIDDFVRDFGHKLSRKNKELALSWKNALPGVYTLVRYQQGRALLMSEAGVFSVCGITYELEQEIGPAPAYVEMVLLPFEDVIVYDGFLQAYDADPSAAELQRIQDEFENRCAKGIALTGADFERQASAYLAEQRDRELDALLEDVARESLRSQEVLPEGFHRGSLAGLDAAQRYQALNEELAERAKHIVPPVREFDRRVRKRAPQTSLAGCLMAMTKDELEGVAQMMGMGGLIKLRKAQMVEAIESELPFAADALEMLLTLVSEDMYRFIKKAMAQGPVTFGEAEVARYFDIWPIEPLMMIFKQGATYTVVIPDELVRLLKTVDFAMIDSYRRQRIQAYNCAEACAVLCGAIAVDDVYDQYRSLVSDVLSRDEFEEMLESADSYGTAGFSLWDYPPTRYVVHYTLSPDFVAQEFAHRREDGVMQLYRDRESGDVNFEYMNKFMRNLRSNLEAELEDLEAYKRDLVESRETLPIRPLSRTLLENDVMSELLDDPNVLRLKAFLDERIPDGQDDYLFADQVVQGMVLSTIESGSLHDLFGYVRDLGLDACTQDEDRLAALVTNVYNAMPSWENNGWSPQELYEQLTGRKMFFNEDGSVMKVGADDLCPCGSGKKYRDCCGR